MRGGQSHVGFQTGHVLHEYRAALQQGRVERAANIRAANPDLAVQLATIDAEERALAQEVPNAERA